MFKKLTPVLLAEKIIISIVNLKGVKKNVSLLKSLTLQQINARIERYVRKDNYTMQLVIHARSVQLANNITQKLSNA